MNIFERILNFFFPKKNIPLPPGEGPRDGAKEASEERTAECQQQAGELPHPPLSSTTAYPPLDEAKEEEKPAKKKVKQVFHTIQEARKALSEEWNKPKKKNIGMPVYDHRMPRDYEKIKMLYGIINKFKSA